MFFAVFYLSGLVTESEVKGSAILDTLAVYLLVILFAIERAYNFFDLTLLMFHDYEPPIILYSAVSSRLSLILS